jgi:pimeloyl-ACP methyl ester carboxylesterase
MLTSFAGSGLFGERFGTGLPWVLALHGWRRDHKDFDHVFGSGGIDALALDLPGFGSAPPPGQVWGSPEYAKAVAAVLDEMGPRVVVLGHSFGGRVAVQLAVDHPERITGLVLSGAPLHRAPGARAKPPLRFKLGRALAARGLLSEEKIEAMRRRYGSEDYRAATGVMREVLVRALSEDYSAVLAALACPVELVWGDDDTEAPLSVAEQLNLELAHAHLVVCKGAGHLTPLTAPGELRAAVERLRP